MQTPSRGVTTKSIGIVISGDPGRKPLCEFLFHMYESYFYTDEILLLYRKNPAIAFNEAARRFSSEAFVGIAGDVFVGETELLQFIDHQSTVVHLWQPLEPIRRTSYIYPFPWTETVKPFVSGLFRCPRSLVVDNPFPEEPSFSEDILWEKSILHLGLDIVAVQVPACHVDYHNPILPRFRILHWIAKSPQRFGAKNPIDGFKAMLKTVAWNYKEIVESIGPRKPSRERLAKTFDELEYLRDQWT